MTADGVTARLIGRASQIGATAWTRCANPEGRADPHPFTQYDFIEALEASGSATAETGWQPAHLVLEQAGAVDGVMPLYVKAHSMGEYVFDHAWADAFRRAGGAYYPKLQAAIPFTPVTGPRLLVAKGADPTQTRQALLATAKAAVHDLNCSSLHITFPTEAEWQAAGDADYLKRTDCQFHWENRGYRNFDDFLAALSSAKRKTLRKERAAIAAAGITFDWLTGSDLTEADWDRFFAFYMDTGERKWGQPYLTRDFFSRIGQTMAHQILLILARHGQTIIAGALNLIGEGVLYGRHWGCNTYVPFLHFETCYYQAIDFAIAHGLTKVEAGAQGEHKLLRGYTPTPTYSAHYIAHRGLRQAVADYLAQERAAVAASIEDLAQSGPFKKA